MYWLARLSWACLLACTCAGAARSEPIAPSILILYQSGAGLQAFDDISEAFRGTVHRRSKTLVAIYEENLDLSRFRGPAYQQTVERFLEEKYRDIPIGVLVAIGSKAFEYALEFRPRLWPDAPLVFAAIDSRMIEVSELPPNTTGLAVRTTVADMVSTARALVPNLKQVALVGDRLEKQTFRSHFINEMPAALAGLQLIDLTGLPMKELLNRVSALPASSAILYTTINIDGEGKVFTPRLALGFVAEVANRPIIVDVATHIGHGATGGHVLMPEPVGRAAAEKVVRILNGVNTSRMPPTIQADALKPVFDGVQLQRWRITETRLPPDSEVRFRQLSFWDRYFWQMAVIILAVAFQAGLLIAIIYEDRLRRAAQAKSGELALEMAHMNRRATAGELAGSIAHEVRQPLAAIVAAASAGQNWLQRNVPNFDEARHAFQNIVRDAYRADGVIENVRAMFKKKALPHEPVDVNEALQQVLAHVQRRLEAEKITLIKVFASDPSPLVMADRVQLQQVFLNLVMNAIEAMSGVKSRSHYLQLRTEIDDNRVLVTVEDSGPGIGQKSSKEMFAPFYTTKPEGMGMGLSICQSIVEAHGGRITAKAGQHWGLVVEVELPLYTGQVQS
jgi:signal transduction histidine kinase